MVATTKPIKQNDGDRAPAEHHDGDSAPIERHDLFRCGICDAKCEKPCTCHLTDLLWTGAVGC